MPGVHPAHPQGDLVHQGAEAKVRRHEIAAAGGKPAGFSMGVQALAFWLRSPVSRFQVGNDAQKNPDARFIGIHMSVQFRTTCKEFWRKSPS